MRGLQSFIDYVERIPYRDATGFRLTEAPAFAALKRLASALHGTSCTAADEARAAIQAARAVEQP